MTTPSVSFTSQLATALRVAATTMFVCCVLYPLLILGIGQTFAPFTANGSLLYNEKGEVIGSSQIAQAFTKPEYFWPRPSAVDYDASAGGGSNLSPAGKELREAAMRRLERLGATPARRVPADLVAASGGGLDPHITLAAAEYQLDRVAAARWLDREAVAKLVRERAETPGGPLTLVPIVNVLELNIALDKLAQ